MKMLTGFVLGVLLLLLMGSSIIETVQNTKLSGYIWTFHDEFSAAFSGMNSDGECFLAITNSSTGRTEIFKITKKVGQSCNDTAFEKGQEGRVVIPSVRRTLALPPVAYP